MGPGFAALAANAPVLDNGSTRVLQLQKLGSAGLEALQYLQSGKSAPSQTGRMRNSHSSSQLRSPMHRC